MSDTRRHLPGDPQPGASVARMIRVDHAGEYGAARIYAGQLAVLRRSDRAARCARCRRRNSSIWIGSPI